MALRFADLAGLAPEEAAPFGGKARGLARLLVAGARVPRAFAVEAAFASEWAEADTAELRRRAGALLPGPVAVRSSAVGEDAAGRSMAGLFETVLSVGSAEAAVEASRRVVSSGEAERVLVGGGLAAPPRVGLVVQEMVAARAAGVAFTVDPMGEDGAVLVEAVAGTGDALVSGRAPPERWRVYRNGLGGLDAHCPAPRGVLSPGEASDVAREGARLAGLLGEPLDLEWALDGAGTLWWLQARPVTAARPPRERVVERTAPSSDDGPVTVWSTWNVRETLPDPLAPLTWGHWRDELLPLVSSQVFGVSRSSPLLPSLLGLDLVDGRLAMNLNALLAVPLFGPLVTRLVGVMDHVAGEAISRLVGEGVLTPRRLAGRRLFVAARMLAATVRSAFRMRHGLFPRRALAVLEADARAVAARPPVGTLADAELLAETRLFSAPECRRLLLGLQMEAVAIAVFGLARRVYADHPAARALLFTGIPANPTTRISLGVDELVLAARPIAPLFAGADGTEALLSRLWSAPEAAPWLARLDAFLSEFGHRGPREFDLAAPRWAEEPGMIVELVRAGLASPGRETVAARMERLASDRKRAIADAVSASPRWKRPLLRLAAGAAEAYLPLREAPKHHGVVVFFRMRKAALELGRRLAARGVLAQAGDVFLLDPAELAGLVAGRPAPEGLRDLLEERRARLERFGERQLPLFVRSDGVPVLLERPAKADAAGVLRGVGVSPGRASGPVRLLASPDPAAMSDGDVLVLRFADPGWTPLFPRAAAVVMEVGGLMCHAAVVAREMGIPAVFGVEGATRLLPDGALVTVDGEAGTVLSAGA
ncbi:MAG: hypothetical protein EDX89_19595 [Acidobacteria bacterium]|nr:MAG: hypothetical protein EDX89_19595 [Acidobacteriota bacterium]